MDAATAIQRLLGLENKTRDPERPVGRPVLTLAYDEGSGGLEVAQELGRRFGVEVYDRRLLDAIASASGIAPEMLERLDDRYQPRWDDWLQAFKADLAAAQVQYYRHLTNGMLAIAQSGGVVVGRGGNIILAQHPVFRVRVVGSREQCARRLVNTRGMAYPAALEHIQRVNAEKARFVEQYFHRAYNDPALFDLVINTDRLPSLEQAAAVVETAMRETGYWPWQK